MRILMLTLLLLLPRAQMTLCAEQTNEPELSAAELIQPSALYSGIIVQEILDAVYAEAEAAIADAYAEGYKQGAIEFAPEATSFRAVSEALETELSSLKKRKRRSVFISLCAGAVGGFALGMIWEVMR